VRIAGGILCLILGISYPMAILLWLNARMRRQPALAPRQVSIVLAFNGVFPLALIGLGVGLLSPGVWAMPSFLPALALVGLAALVLLLISWRLGAVTGGAPQAAPMQPGGQSPAGEAAGSREGDDERGITGAGI
jgi:hypothetical protein